MTDKEQWQLNKKQLNDMFYELENDSGTLRRSDRLTWDNVCKMMDKLLKSQDEWLDDLADMVNQHCQWTQDGEKIINSLSLSSNAYAMRKLAKHGRIEIIEEYGKRVIGRWIDK